MRLNCGIGRRAWIGPAPGLGHVVDRRVVGAERPRAHVRHFRHRRRPQLVLEAAAPRLAVLDAVGVVHDAAADGAGGVARQDVARLQRRHAHVGRDVDLLGEEERQVARERRLHAVGPLVQEDAVAAADDGARVVQREREAEARRQAHGARIQQAAAPAGLLRRHVRNRNQRQQRVRARVDVAVLVAGDDEAAAGHRQIDRRQPVVHVVHVLVVLVAQADVERQVARAPASRPARRGAASCVRPFSSPRPMPDAADVG